MTTDGQKPLQVGQVLEGLLEAGAVAQVEDDAVTGELSAGGGATSAAALPVTLWERMMAAVDVKFDGDNDGDVRGKG